MNTSKLTKYLTIGLLALSSSLHAAEKLTPYKVGFNNWVGFIGFFVAQEQGYFEDVGLDVQAVSFGAPGEGIVPLINGNLDAHLTTADSVITRLDKAPDSMKIVYLIDTSNGADALVAADGIETVADLKGKKVAVTVGECNHLLLAKALESAGMTEDDIIIANMDPDAAGSALKAGSVDAAVTWEPWISTIISTGGKAIYSSADVPNLLLDCVAVSEATLEEKGEATQAFIDALSKGQAYVAAHPSEASAMIADVIDWTAEDIEATLPTITLYGAADNEAQMTGSSLAIAKELAVFFEAQGISDNEVEVTELFDTRYLK
jgi:NitT/TauT family transport system substrate-binding protein